MAREIDTTTGRAAVMVAGDAPWHRLGVNVKEAQTSEAAIKLAGLDWNVDQLPVFAARDTDAYQAKGYVANVRTDTNAVLGIVGDGYRVFQNREAFDFMDAIVGDKLAMFETAGSLRGGRQVWMMARIPGELRATANDVTLPYVLLSNSHDGSRALRMIPTAVRVVCQNTLTLALRRGGTGGIVIRHSESLADRVAEARTALGIVSDRLQQHEQEVQALAKKQVTIGQLAEYFATVVAGTTLGDKNKELLLKVLGDNLNHDTNRIPGIEGTAWAAYNAVSWYADHQMRSLGKTDAQRTEVRLNSVWFGQASNLKQAAYEAALKLVSA